MEDGALVGTQALPVAGLGVGGEWEPRVVAPAMAGCGGPRYGCAAAVAVSRIDAPRRYGVTWDQPQTVEALLDWLRPQVRARLEAETRLAAALAEARAAWGDRVIIWGGVPSVILEEPFTEDQFEAYMDDLFRTIAPGSAFILGIADNAMPGTKIERVKRITAMVQQRGAIPIAG